MKFEMQNLTPWSHDGIDPNGIQWIAVGGVRDNVLFELGFRKTSRQCGFLELGLGKLLNNTVFSSYPTM